MRRRVVVTGVGVISALGVGTERFWRGLTAGATGLTRAPAGLAAAGSRVVGVVDDFSATPYLRNERHSRVLCRTFELLVGAGAMAAADGALGATPIPPSRLAVVVGMGSIDQYSDDVVAAARAATTNGIPGLARFAETARTMHPFRRLRLLPNVGAALLSIEHQAMGPSLTFVSGHTAGLQALSQAFVMIADGRTDAAICAAADARVTPLGIRLFAACSPLSASSDPTHACRPFDETRDGTVAGEGSAALLLEAEDSARARGVNAYAEVVGTGAAGVIDGGCAESMRQAVLMAGGATPDVVVAHGDGGVRSDRLEAAAIDLIAPRCVTSVPGAVGHTMSACGALNSATACLVLANGCVPAICGLDSSDMALPFATHNVHASFASVLVNAIEPGHAAASVLFARV